MNQHSSFFLLKKRFSSFLSLVGLSFFLLLQLDSFSQSKIPESNDELFFNPRINISLRPGFNILNTALDFDIFHEANITPIMFEIPINNNRFAFRLMPVLGYSNYPLGGLWDWGGNNEPAPYVKQFKSNSDIRSYGFEAAIKCYWLPASPKMFPRGAYTSVVYGQSYQPQFYFSSRKIGIDIGYSAVLYEKFSVDFGFDITYLWRDVDLGYTPPDNFGGGWWFDWWWFSRETARLMPKISLGYWFN
jgi:hypothetical protein